MDANFQDGRSIEGGVYQRTAFIRGNTVYFDPQLGIVMAGKFYAFFINFEFMDKNKVI